MGVFKFDKCYLNCCIEANQVKFSPFSRFKLHTLVVHYSVPPSVLLIKFMKYGIVQFLLYEYLEETPNSV